MSKQCHNLESIYLFLFNFDECTLQLLYTYTYKYKISIDPKLAMPECIQGNEADYIKSGQKVSSSSKKAIIKK